MPQGKFPWVDSRFGSVQREYERVLRKQQQEVAQSSRGAVGWAAYQQRTHVQRERIAGLGKGGSGWRFAAQLGARLAAAAGNKVAQMDKERKSKDGGKPGKPANQCSSLRGTAPA